MKCKFTKAVVLALTIIGAINWGLWGFFQFDLVAWLCGGNTTWPSRIVYAVIGIAGLLAIKALCCCKGNTCPCCHGEGGSCSCNKEGGKGKGGGCCSK